MQNVHMDDLANPQSAQVRIKASKTDPFHQGVLVYFGHTNPVPSLCIAGLHGKERKQARAPVLPRWQASHEAVFHC